MAGKLRWTGRRESLLLGSRAEELQSSFFMLDSLRTSWSCFSCESTEQGQAHYAREGQNRMSLCIQQVPAPDLALS